jgi:hypothetical protein
MQTRLIKVVALPRGWIIVALALACWAVIFALTYAGFGLFQ